jgi:hypothetical protein
MLYMRIREGFFSDSRWIGASVLGSLVKNV